MTDLIMDSVFNEYTKLQIQKHEGYRDCVYIDSVGVPTGGWGHAFLEGSCLPKTIWEMMFEFDYNTHKESFQQLVWQRQYQDLSPARKAVLLNMIFNMGIRKVLQFQKTLEALDRREYELVAKMMLQSKWASQVGNRAHELAKQMATGQWIGITTQ